MIGAHGRPRHCHGNLIFGYGDCVMIIQETDRGLKVEFTLRMPHSLHSRPAARLAQTARRFKSDILLISESGEVDAKSMLDILSLAPEPNARLQFLARGPDAREALIELCSFMTNYKE